MAKCPNLKYIFDEAGRSKPKCNAKKDSDCWKGIRSIVQTCWTRPKENVK